MLFGRSPYAPKGVQDCFRGKGLCGHPRIKGRERIINGVHDGCRRTGCARLARAFGAEFGASRWRDHMADVDIRHLAGHGHEVIGHGAVEQLPLPVIDALLKQRRRNPTFSSSSQTT